jgi:hypothetical protein
VRTTEWLFLSILAFSRLPQEQFTPKTLMEGTAMNLVLKKLAALTSATALLSAGLVGITASAASAASAPLTMTFEDNDTSGYFYGAAMELGADFGGVVSSRETSLPGGRAGAGLKFEIGGEPWSGTTIIKTTTAAQADGTLFSDTARYAEIDVYSTVAGDMMFKLEGGCNNDIRVAHTGNGWETLKFENLAVTGCTIGSFFALNGVADRNGKTVYIDNLSLPGFATADVVVPVTAPSTLIDFASANAITYFGGTAGEITDAPAGASAGDALKVSTSGECWGGATIQDQATSVTLLSAGKTTVTANVHVPAAGARVRLKLESSLDNTILVETDAIASAAGWNRLSWNLSGYNAANVYNRASVFPGFSCGVDGARVTGDYYFDDIAFNGAVTPKLAPTAKITSPSKKVIAVTVANAKGKTLVISVVGVRKATIVVPVAASKTYKISVPSSGTYRVSVTVGATSVVKRVTTK